MAYFLSDSNVLSAFWSLIRSTPLAARMAFTASSTFARLSPTVFRTSRAGPPTSASASSRCSLETYASPSFFASASARVSMSISARPGVPAPDEVVGWRLSSAPATCPTRAASTPARDRIDHPGPFLSCRSAAKRCSPVTSGFPRAAASDWASASVCWALVVNRSILMPVSGAKAIPIRRAVSPLAGAPSWAPSGTRSAAPVPPLSLRQRNTQAATLPRPSPYTFHTGANSTGPGVDDCPPAGYNPAPS